MTFPAEEFKNVDHTKTNHLQQCYYVMNMIKDLDAEKWLSFQGQLAATRPEESWDLYQILVEEYRKLSGNMPARRAPAKKSTKRKPTRAASMKRPVKKVAKKAVKKKAPVKTAAKKKAKVTAAHKTRAAR